MTAANITEDQKTAFKAHLRKCWKLPGTVASPTTRVVLRVYLRRDGKLGAEPVLIEASASRDGPVVMRTAVRALNPMRTPKCRHKRLVSSPRNIAIPVY